MMSPWIMIGAATELYSEECSQVAQIWLEFWKDAGWIQKAWWGRGVERGYPVPPGTGLGGAMPPPRKKMNFSLEMACLMHSERYFCPCPCLKWWFGGHWRCTFGKWWIQYFVRIMGLINFLLHYCIVMLVMQAIWCLKFWNMTKSEGQFALASLPSNFGGLVPPWFTPIVPTGQRSVKRVKRHYSANAVAVLWF